MVDHLTVHIIIDIFTYKYVVIFHLKSGGRGGNPMYLSIPSKKNKSILKSSPGHELS